VGISRRKHMGNLWEKQKKTCGNLSRKHKADKKTSSSKGCTMPKEGMNMVFGEKKNRRTEKMTDEEVGRPEPENHLSAGFERECFT